MTEIERRRKITLAGFMWGGFVRCPTTGCILEVLEGDDKAICRCGVSNPKVPTECTERTGTHIVRFLQTATAAEYVDERK